MKRVFSIDQNLDYKVSHDLLSQVYRRFLEVLEESVNLMDFQGCDETIHTDLLKSEQNFWHLLLKGGQPPVHNQFYTFLNPLDSSAKCASCCIKVASAYRENKVGKLPCLIALKSGRSESYIHGLMNDLC